MVLLFYSIRLGDLLSPGPLALPHARYEGLNHCTLCHELFGGVSDERCLACHREIRRSLARPLSYHSRAKGPCRQCHPDHRGKELEMVRLDERAFAHDRETTYPLEGKHARVPCEKCHKSDRPPRYSGLRRDCAGCHRDVHQGRWDERCEGCHRAQNWKPVQGYWARVDFDHGKTRFSLMGRHAKVPCQDCHRRGKEAGYRDTPRSCAGCHRDIHRPSWGTDCQRCHGVEGWQPQEAYWKRPGFDHRKTRFSLAGRHLKAPCQDCHRRGERVVYRGTPRNCTGCHGDVHRPSWGADCQRCHGVEGWRPKEDYWRQPGFDHARFAYPLEGRHPQVPCASCHLEGRWKGLAHGRCDECHSDRHQAQFPGRDCRECHALSAWQPSTFRHQEGSCGNGYRLDPLHQAVGCEKCHPILEELAQSSGLKAQNRERSDLSFELPTRIEDNRNAPKASARTKGARYRPLEATCRGCHRESDQFYRGRYAGLPLSPLPEAKSEAVECQACHDPSRRREQKGKFALLSEAQEGCIRCHNESYGRLFSRWQEILQEKGARLEAKLERLKHLMTTTSTDRPLLQFYLEADRARRLLERERYHNLLLANSIYEYYLENFRDDLR